MSRSTRSWWRLGAVVLAFSLVAAACGNDDNKNDNAGGTTKTTAAKPVEDVTLLCGQGKAAPNTYSLAFVGPKTGDAANLGINILQGAQFAIEQENARQDDITFKLEICDTQGSKDQAPGQFALYNPDATVLGVIGPAFSGESIASLPSLQQAGLVMISASATNADIPNTVANQTVFHRLLPDDTNQAEGIAKFLKTKYKNKSVYYIDDKSDYGKPLADAVAPLAKANGNPDKGHSEIEPKDDLYTSAVNDAKRADADVIFYGGYYNEAGKLKKQLTDAGVTSLFISGDGSLDDGFITAGGAQSNGAIISCPCNLATESATGALGEFTKAYQARFKGTPKSNPGTYSSEAYDAANILMKGIEAGNTTRAKLLAYVEALKTYNGISKKIEFQPNGNLKSTTVYFFQVKNGKFAPLTNTDKL